MDERWRDRVAGAVLGTFVGDAAGAPSEGRPPRADREVPEPARGAWSYTDDTQMALALAEHLTERDQVEPPELARLFRARYEPWRGYGAGTRKVLAAWDAGVPVAEAAVRLFDGGSYGNGAAMRVAPVGARFHRAPQRVRREAERASAVTHAHPVGIDAAVLQALAVAEAVRSGDFGPDALSRLAGQATTEPLREALRVAAELATSAADADARRVAAELGNDSSAQRSVPTALYLAATAGSFAAGVRRALRVGGDTDTIAAMTGAVLGAAAGVEAIPRPWLEALEDGPHGRPWALALAQRLADRVAADQPGPDRPGPTAV